MVDAKNPNLDEFEYYKLLEKYFSDSETNVVTKLKNFPKYVPRQDITRFLVRYEIFKKVLNIAGSIVECGVLHGAGLLTFAHLSSILEPVNQQRKIIGFDTFEGFPEDGGKYDNPDYAKKNTFNVDSFDDINQAINLFDKNRFLNFLPKIKLVKGDVKDTIPSYIEEHPELTISMLYIDLDLYEPTKIALENFVPKMPKGGIIVFDDLNDSNWSGETMALFDTIGIKNLKLERFPFDSRVAYAILD